jgi:iron-sulfur cluster repair protein YtfE (RIC family)
MRSITNLSLLTSGLKLPELAEIYNKEKIKACGKGKEAFDEWVNNNGLQLEELEGKINRRMFNGSSRASIVTKTGKLCGETVSLE